jgi:hypothetical protein
MYANSAAVSRPEISTFLEEATKAEDFYIAQKIMPVFTSKSRAGRYPRLKIENGELMKAQSTLRGPSGTYNEVARKFDWETYDCEDRGLEERIDDVNAREMQNFFDTEVVTAKLVRRSVVLDYEKRVADQIMNPDSFNAVASHVGYTEANLATIDFARDLLDAVERLEQRAQMANTMILTRAVFNLLRRSKLLQTYLFGNLGAGTEHRLINPTDIGNAFGIKDVRIAAATYDRAQKGKPKELVPVWKNDYIFLGNVQGGDFENGGIGRTIVWDSDSPGGLFATETYRDEKRRGNMVRVRMNTDEKIVDETAGELITTQFE